MRWKVALLTASDKGSRGEREGTSAQIVRELVEEELGGDIVDYRIVPDDQDDIRAALIEMADYYQADLVLTTGGTGLGLRDVTPEATLMIAERVIPGMAETMRAAEMQRSRMGMLFRGVCVIRGNTLIVNLPGDPKGVSEHLMAIMDMLPEAMEQVKGMRRDTEL